MNRKTEAIKHSGRDDAELGHDLGLGPPPVHHGARGRDLRLPAVSRVRLPHAQQGLPPDRPVRQEPFSHGPLGDAELARDGFRAAPRRKEVGGSRSDLPVMLASQVNRHKYASHSLDFTFCVQEMGGSSP